VSPLRGIKGRAEVSDDDNRIRSSGTTHTLALLTITAARHDAGD